MIHELIMIIEFTNSSVEYKYLFTNEMIIILTICVTCDINKDLFPS